MASKTDAQRYLDEFYPATGEKVGLSLLFFTQIGLLVGSVRSFRKGEVDKAIYKAIVWNGLTANQNATDLLKLKQAKRYRDNYGFHSAGWGK